MYFILLKSHAVLQTLNPHRLQDFFCQGKDISDDDKIFSFQMCRGNCTLFSFLQAHSFVLTASRFPEAGCCVPVGLESKPLF